MNEPYLDSERHFRRYENYIKDIVVAWPRAINFSLQPPVCSVDTLSSRIRICIKSLRNHQWKVDWDFVKFLQICDEIVVSTTAAPGNVVCGPYDVVRKVVPLGRPVEPVQVGAANLINLVDPDEQLIDAVMCLHHHQILLEPSTITSTKDLVALAESYDISVEREGDIYTIL